MQYITRRVLPSRPIQIETASIYRRVQCRTRWFQFNAAFNTERDGFVIYRRVHTERDGFNLSSRSIKNETASTVAWNTERDGQFQFGYRRVQKRNETASIHRHVGPIQKRDGFNLPSRPMQNKTASIHWRIQYRNETALIYRRVQCRTKRLQFTDASNTERDGFI